MSQFRSHSRILRLGTAELSLNVTWIFPRVQISAFCVCQPEALANCSSLYQDGYSIVHDNNHFYVVATFGSTHFKLDTMVVDTEWRASVTYLSEQYLLELERNPSVSVFIIQDLIVDDMVCGTHQKGVGASIVAGAIGAAYRLLTRASSSPS